MSTPLSTTQLRKLAAGTTIALVEAPFVRFTKGDDRQWHEVKRMGVQARTLNTDQAFLLGVTVVS